MSVKALLFLFLLIPFIGASQINESSVKLDTSIFSLPSSKQSFQFIRVKKELDSSFFKISFSPTKSQNIKAIRTRVLKAHFNYSIATDTSSIDSTILMMIDQTNLNNLIHIGD